MLKKKFSKQGLFMSGWDLHYGDLIEWRAASAGGKISESRSNEYAS